MKYLIHFEDEQAHDPRIVGQKFYTLAKAVRRGFAVPQAVAISTAAHRYFLTHHCWPDGLLADVLSEAVRLDLSKGVSIRSSATREDLEKQSFAGQYRSFLQVVSKDDLKADIEKCWQSVSSETVGGYIDASNLAETAEKKPLMAVVVQKMVEARAAGIAFGRNPMKTARKEIVIEAVPGLAESVVSGHQTPYRAVVDENETVKITPPYSKNGDVDDQDSLLYSYPFWRQIARLVKDLEFYNGKKSLDIEWAVDNQNKIWLLQSRTITTIDDTAPQIPPGLWTRKIANDLWADRLTPFMSHHMVTNASHFDLSRTLKILGIPVIRPTLTVIKGYLYINGESIKKGISHIPVKFRLPEIGSLLPSKPDTDPLSGPSRWTFFTMCIRSVLLLIMEPGVNPLISLRLAKHDLETINRQIDRVTAMPIQSPRLTFDKVLATLNTLTRLQTKNQWPYFFATFTTWVLRWLVVQRLGLSHADFLNILSKNANNISIKIERHMRRMAQDIAGNKDLADLFLHMSADELANNPPLEIKAGLGSFLTRFGCRSRHRTLFLKRWSESPQEVIGMLQSLVRGHHLKSTKVLSFSGLPTSALSDAPPAESTNNEKPTCSADNSVTNTAGGLPYARSFLRLIGRITRRFLDLREDSRFTLDRILHLLRQTLLTLGDQTGLDDKVMFLTADELEDIVQGKLGCMEAKPKGNLSL
jgi:pyruvate,water dikinase